MNKSTKNICLVVHSLQAGGMERVMTELANHFAKKENVNVHLVLYGKTREIFYTITGDVVIHKPSFEFKENRRLLYTLKTIHFLRKRIKEISPDTVLSIGEYWNSLVLIATMGLGYPIFVSDRNQPNKSLGKLQDKLRNWLYPFAKGVIAQTSKAKEIYIKQYNHKNIAVIGNPIRSIDINTGITERENIVLTVGRLISSKHHDKLIELFVKINQPGWKLIIIGYDHLKQQNHQRLEALIDKLDASNKVLLAGKQSNVEEYYLRSKVFAFTSSSEGFPNVIGEAMSAGLPAVAFDCVAGPSEMIVNNENGFLVPLYDYTQFEEKLSLLMTDEELRKQMGEQAKNDIKKFNAAQIGDHVYNFIIS